MAEIVTMPKLGFDMAEGTLVNWIIQEGEQVAKGAVLAEIETDKATVEVESVFEGYLSKHLVSEGDIVPVNTPIAVVGGADEEVNLDDLLASLAPEGEEIPESREASETGEPVPGTMEVEVPDEAAGYPAGVMASPLARRMAADMGINLKAVQGTGAGGRIVKRDIEEYLKAPTAEPVPLPEKPADAARTQLSPLMPVMVAETPEDRIVPLDRLRGAIGRRMTEVKQTVPHFYVTHEYDMSAVMELRQQINAMLPEGCLLYTSDAADECPAV